MKRICITIWLIILLPSIYAYTIIDEQYNGEASNRNTTSWFFGNNVTSGGPNQIINASGLCQHGSGNWMQMYKTENELCTPTDVMYCNYTIRIYRPIGTTQTEAGIGGNVTTWTRLHSAGRNATYMLGNGVTNYSGHNTTLVEGGFDFSGNHSYTFIIRKNNITLFSDNNATPLQNNTLLEGQKSQLQVSAYDDDFMCIESLKVTATITGIATIPNRTFKIVFDNKTDAKLVDSEDKVLIINSTTQVGPYEVNNFSLGKISLYFNKNGNEYSQKYEWENNYTQDNNETLMILKGSLEQVWIQVKDQGNVEQTNAKVKFFQTNGTDNTNLRLVGQGLTDTNGITYMNISNEFTTIVKAYNYGKEGRTEQFTKWDKDTSMSYPLVIFLLEESDDSNLWTINDLNAQFINRSETYYVYISAPNSKVAGNVMYYTDYNGFEGITSAEKIGYLTWRIPLRPGIEYPSAGESNITITYQGYNKLNFNVFSKNHKIIYQGIKTATADTENQQILEIQSYGISQKIMYVLIYIIIVIIACIMQMIVRTESGNVGVWAHNIGLIIATLIVPAFWLAAISGTIYLLVIKSVKKMWQQST